MEIIPAIDIIDGKCVRLTEGDFLQKKVYHDQPLEIAKKFESFGFKRLHIVDLDGAKSGEVKNWDILRSIAKHTNLKIDFGGGINNFETAGKVLDFGASWITIGSMAVKNTEEYDKIILGYGAGALMIGADVKDEEIMIRGWQENSSVKIFDFLEEQINKGIRQVFCTDISKDGMLAGPSTVLYNEIIKKFPELFFIASGGVSRIEDLHALKNIGCKAVIIGKAIYENRISLQELADFSKN